MTEKIDLTRVLREKLQTGEVRFAYRKKTGELRIAVGTTKIEFIPVESQPKGTGPERSNACAYWDLNSSGWRAYNPMCVVWVENVGHDNLTKEEYDSIFKFIFDNPK